MSSRSEDVVLVTGFPSFRARKLVEQLLADPAVREVHVIVHARLAAQAARFLASLGPEDASRLVVHPGDAAAIDLGLSGAERRELAGRIHRIHHLAQTTYPGTPRDLAVAVNVGGFREVLELARDVASLDALVVHSSVAVVGDRRGVVLEEELACGQGFRSVVEETLAVAERNARAAMGEVPIVVVRPAHLVGDSVTGEIDRLDGPYLLVWLMLSAPEELPLLLPARGDRPLCLVPVDHVMRVARQLGRDPRALGRTFHVVDPAPLSARRVFEAVARASGRRGPRGFIPGDVSRYLLRAPGLPPGVRTPRSLVDMMTTDVRYDDRGARERLDGTGIACPPFESYVGVLVGFVRRQLEERRHAGDEAAEEADRAGGTEEVEDALA
ncbi:MAG: SDR family oxidoreductase [Deltaproteobacteria bacterium]|nr:SDR family oxidoreductase [Deltaproteobacteria bacterium]